MEYGANTPLPNTKRPAREILVLSLVLGVGMIAALTLLAYRGYNRTERREACYIKVVNLNGQIVHLDEVLTMSARMAAATGDLKWETRYKTFESQLDLAIKETSRLAPEQIMSEAAAQTDEANVALVAMENQAFALIREGKQKEAFALLHSEAYDNHKATYSEGIRRYQRQLETHFKSETDHAHHVFGWILLSLGLAALTVPCFGVYVTQFHKRSLDRDLAAREKERLAHRLQVRLNELGCMYKIASTIRRHASTEKMLQDAACLMPPAWQHPERARARIVYGENEFLSEPFTPTSWSLSRDLVVEGEVSGRVEIYYLEATVTENGDPFTIAEKQLIGSIADALSEAIEHDLSEEALCAAFARLEAANQDLKEMQGQVIQSEKLAAIGQLAAGVAHEVNTPVGFVASNFQSLRNYMNKIIAMLQSYEAFCHRLEEGQGDGWQSALEDVRKRRRQAKIDFVLDDVQQLFEESEEGLDRVTGIVQNLRDFSRIDQACDVTDFDLNEGIEATLIVAQNKLKYHCDVSTEFGEIPSVICNSGQVNQVILNILVNASQAIQSQERSERGRIAIRTYATEDAVCCDISDDGPGIPLLTQSRVFEPFFTTKEAGKGTGLGLSVSYDIIVNKHKGMLSVESTEGEGTTFKITLPLSHKVAAAQAAASNEG